MIYDKTTVIQKLDSFKLEIKKLYQSKNSGKKNHVMRYLETYYNRFGKMIELIVEAFDSGKKKKVLDIGIAYGFYGIILKEEYGFDVMGMELKQFIPKYCALCSKHKIQVKAGDLIKKTFPFSKGQFDVIVLGEIIEHIPLSPYLMFKRLKPYLKKNGIIVVTVPNIAHKRNIKRLLLGLNINERFSRDIEPTTKVDTRTHVREYDRFELERDLEDADFLTEKIEMVDSEADAASIFTKIFPRFKKYIMIRARKK